MNSIEYVELGSIDPADFLPVLNKQRIRAHLIDHPPFDEQSVAAWLKTKTEMDAAAGCRVRAVRVDDVLAGWCGIQLEDGQYGLALVLDDAYWGLGKRIFAELIAWAKALGHQTVVIQFLHTRPEYRFLRKMARRVYESELMGSKFTTYELALETL